MTSVWKIDINFKNGDVVFIKKYIHFSSLNKNMFTYYKCIINHVSDALINPLNFTNYWVELQYNPNQSIQIERHIDFIENPNKSVSIKPFQLPIKIQETNKQKRKIKNIDYEINNLKKKRKFDYDINLEDQIKLMNINIETKLFLLDKYENIKFGNADSVKATTWLKTVLNIPFGNYNKFKVNINDKSQKINDYLKNIREHLDSKIYNMDSVKDEIIEYLARKISNPNSKGHVLALCGPAGVAKSKMLQTLGEALNMPFYKINFGGLSDVAILTGHSETYIGSKPGKFVEILGNSGCMNPIIFMDEVDKYNNKEINGILTHLLDEEQNDKFQDNYLSNINIDLSKVFFVVAFNDIKKVDPIVLDRMKVIYIDPPQLKDKIIIAIEKIIPIIIDSFKFKKDKYINLDKELILYIISNKIQQEPGVRQLKKALEKIFSKLNYLIITGQYQDKKNKENFTIISEIENNDENNDVKIECINIKKHFIDVCLGTNKNENKHYMQMYI